MPLYTGAPKLITPSYNVLQGTFLQQIPRAVYPGTTAFLFGIRKTAQLPLALDNIVGETPVAGQASVSVSLATQGGADVSLVPNVGIELIFSGNPGVANLQVQEADTDADQCYITPAPAAFTITTFGPAPNYITRVDLGTIGSNFVRLFVSLYPNAVTLIARLTVQ